MNFESLASLLTKIEDKTVFLRFNPEVLDFTEKDSPCEMEFFVPEGTNFKISLKDETLPLILSFLSLSLFDKDRKILTWNWKSFASYIFSKTGKFYDIKSSIIDLKIIESYNGIKKPVPETYSESLNRLKNLVSSGLWKESELIYKKIHLPLMTTVIPALEKVGIVDFPNKSKVHAYYEINGQENGRLKCYGAFSKSFVPHAMGAEFRQGLRPIGYDNLFMSFDFRGMEVFVLSHLSNDANLKRLCAEDDIYSSLYRVIFGSDSEKNDRELAKKCFLPVIYGQSAKSLADRCGLALDVAEMAVKRISSLFPAAISFVAECEDKVKFDGYAKDVFGKRRSNFDSGKEYLARNFAVQSPAATICSEKLISLYFSLNKLNESLKDKAEIAYTVHDGYVVYVTKENWKQVYKKGMDALTSESELCPGLKLKVSCKGGRNLNDLKSIRNP